MLSLLEKHVFLQIKTFNIMENELVSTTGFEQVASLFELFTYGFGLILCAFAVIFSLITLDEKKKNHPTLY
jgi:hypothetical protein